MFVTSFMLFQQNSSSLSCSLLFFQSELNYPPCFFSCAITGHYRATRLTFSKFSNCITPSAYLLIFPSLLLLIKVLKPIQRQKYASIFLIGSTTFYSTIFILVREKEKVEKGDWMEGCVGNVNDALLSQVLQHEETVCIF